MKNVSYKWTQIRINASSGAFEVLVPVLASANQVMRVARSFKTKAEAIEYAKQRESKLEHGLWRCEIIRKLELVGHPAVFGAKSPTDAALKRACLDMVIAA